MVDTASAPTGWLVGAYAAAPSRVGWDQDDEAEFYEALWALPGVVGLELPWASGAFHARDERWLLEHLPDVSQIVVTTAPDASTRHRASASFGLASADEGGRRAAIEAVRALHASLPRLRTATPLGRVLAVQLHAAPRAEPGASSADLLAASLRELADWDWDGAQLVVEHCDAWMPSRPPAKGYLLLDDEIPAIAALRREGLPVGLSLNWGRSVIEARNADAGREHARLAAAAGVLEGIVFSGAATAATPLGGAWADVHAPFADGEAYASSLLTPEHASAVLIAAGDVRFRGVKVGAPAAASVADRVAIIARALEGVRSVGT